PLFFQAACQVSLVCWRARYRLCFLGVEGRKQGPATLQYLHSIVVVRITCCKVHTPIGIEPANGGVILGLSAQGPRPGRVSRHGVPRNGTTRATMWVGSWLRHSHRVRACEISRGSPIERFGPIAELL